MKELSDTKHFLYESEPGSAEFKNRKEKYLSLYFAKRGKYEKGFLANMTIRQHQLLHKILLWGIRISNRLQGNQYRLLRDDRADIKMPKVFVATHIGKSDIEMICEAIKEHCYILTNGFEALYHTFDGFVLSLNGVIYFNYEDKTDRKRAAAKMVEILRSGGNVLIFPEAAYNLTPNVPVTPLNWGAVKAAQAADAQIVPVAIEQYGKNFIICIGKFDMSKYGKDENGVSHAVRELRDTLASLKWEIWENEPGSTHTEAAKTDWDAYIAAQLEGTGDTPEDVIRERYRDKTVTFPEEAFAHLDRLIPCRENAFLLRGIKSVRN